MSFLRQKDEAVIPRTYQTKIETILGSKIELPDAKLGWDWKTLKEAQRYQESIPQLKADLSALKQEVNASMKEVRDRYNEKRGAVQPNPVLKLVSKKQASQRKARKREQLREQQESDLAPLQATRKEIDRLLLQLDSYRQRLEAWVKAQS